MTGTDLNSSERPTPRSRVPDRSVRGMTLMTQCGRPQLVIRPQRPSLDTVLSIGIHGLSPGTEVTLRAALRDPRAGEWRSSATFAGGPDGTVDLHRDAPVRGSYQGTDPMGLIWSMEPCEEPDPHAPGDFLAPTPLSVVAEIAGQQVSAAQVLRLRVPDGVSRTNVREHGLVGTLYCPDGDHPLPGVLLLGGAEGGMHEDDAALLAAHGYAALALAYYGLPGLPPTLHNIPLECFGTAITVMQRHPRVRADRLGVMGASKGGEAALLVAATFPQVKAAVSVVGSGLVTQGASQDVVTGSFLDILNTPVANWTYRGQPLPFLPFVVTPEMKHLVANSQPVTLGMAFQPALQHTDLLPAATIPVERIHGGVLLISSSDDQGYGVVFHEHAAQRLAAHNHPHTWRHIVHDGAGHNIAAPPYAPTTQSLSAGPGVTFRAGGTPAADARARADTWQTTLQFLADQLSQ